MLFILFLSVTTFNFRKGDLQGRTITLKGGAYPLEPVNVFLGIPYALPPTGVWRLVFTMQILK